MEKTNFLSFFFSIIMLLYHIQFITHTVLAECLQTMTPKLRSALLQAYATQKVAQMEKQIFKCLEINEFMVKTHRNLCNRKIISYKAEFTMDSCYVIPPIIIDNSDEMVTEQECRRTIQSSHSQLTNYFGNSCNDFSDMKYHSRELEIVLENYRLIINPIQEVYSIQYKKCQSSKLIFLKETLTLEASYSSVEGPVHENPIALKVINEDNVLIGVASFLDSKDLSVKTTYLKYKNSLTLYQRVGVDDYSKSYPFILELENVSNTTEYAYAANLYFETAWRLEAKLPEAIAQEHLVLLSNSKPIFTPELDKVKDAITLPKLDGYPATLRFYETHFTISNSMTSQSYRHKLNSRNYHIIKDYRFLVESQLYESNSSNKTNNKYAMAIIDIQTGAAFKAKTRYEIMQQLRQKFENVFSKYNIFFNCEAWAVPLAANGMKRKRVYDLELKDGKIYEVLLNEEYKVIDILRERRDKLKPNSGKLIRAMTHERVIADTEPMGGPTASSQI